MPGTGASFWCEYNLQVLVLVPVTDAAALVYLLQIALPKLMHLTAAPSEVSSNMKFSGRMSRWTTFML